MAVEKHPRLYFSDGNIVLSAKKRSSPRGAGGELVADEKTLLFRVHKSICSLHSEVFARMIRDGSESASELYEGTAVVQMPSDTVEEVEAMLEVMYGLSEWKKLAGLRHPDFPLLIENLMEMATKYEMVAIRQEIVDAMQHDWPSTPEEWHESQSVAENFPRFLNPLPEPAAALVFARRFNLLRIHAVALYALSCIDSRVQWGDKQMDGVTDNGWKGKGARWHLLTRDDLLCLDQLRELQRDVFLSFQRTESHDCKIATARNEFKDKLIKDRDALRTCTALVLPLCYTCNRKGTFLRLREKLWDGLLEIGQKNMSDIFNLEM